MLENLYLAEDVHSELKLFTETVERFWTDARVLRIYGGTSEVMKELVARSIIGR